LCHQIPAVLLHRAAKLYLLSHISSLGCCHLLLLLLAWQKEPAHRATPIMVIILNFV